MNNVVILMDIGGTRTRAAVVNAEHAVLSDQEMPASIQTKLSDKHTLLTLITGLVAEYRLKDRIEAAVLCFAGPVRNHLGVTMTNWNGERSISYAELRECGLPQQTMLVNDVEAACYFLVSVDKDAQPRNTIELYPGRQHRAHRPDNKVVMVPGTGIGTAAIVYPEHPSIGVRPMIVPGEIQHACLPTLATEDTPMLGHIARQLNRRRLDWEDIVSGQGLSNVYSWLGSVAADRHTGLDPLARQTAETIAERALQGADPDCSTALHTYYRYAGALAQLLALCFQPLGGIYLAGATSRANASFIPQSRFLSELHDNSSQGELLETYPVYLIADEINLRGAACLASLQIQGEVAFSVLSPC